MSRLAKLLEPVKRRVLLALARGVVQITDAARKCQEVQVSLLSDETRQVEHFQQYGFASHPKRPDASGGCEAFVGFIGGNRDHGIALGTVDRRSRPTTLAEGDVAVFNDLGEEIRLGRDNTVTIKTGGTGADKRIRLDRDEIRLETGDSGLSIELNDDEIIVRYAANKSVTVDADSIVLRMGEGGKRIELTETRAIVDMGASGVKLEMDDTTQVLHCGPSCRIRLLPTGVSIEAPSVTFVQT